MSWHYKDELASDSSPHLYNYTVVLIKLFNTMGEVFIIDNSFQFVAIGLIVFIRPFHSMRMRLVTAKLS